MANMPDFRLRIRTPKGEIRVSVPDSTLLSTLQTTVQEKCELEADRQECKMIDDARNGIDVVAILIVLG